nr:hypothetical protein Iba_chr04fCG13730 [Ipomoea batatas]
MAVSRLLNDWQAASSTTPSDTIIASPSVHAMIIPHDGVVVYVNAAVFSESGQASFDVIGMPIYSVETPPDAFQVCDPLSSFPPLLYQLFTPLIPYPLKPCDLHNPVGRGTVVPLRGTKPLINTPWSGELDGLPRRPDSGLHPHLGSYSLSLPLLRGHQPPLASPWPREPIGRWLCFPTWAVASLPPGPPCILTPSCLGSSCIFTPSCLGLPCVFTPSCIGIPYIFHPHYLGLPCRFHPIALGCHVSFTPCLGSPRLPYPLDLGHHVFLNPLTWDNFVLHLP